MRAEEERIINIVIPEDYIRCKEPEEATHVFLDGYRVEHIVGDNDSIWGRSITDPDTQVLTSLNFYGPRITAYLRTTSEAEPFRLVLEDCDVDTNFDVESDYTWIRVTMDGVSKFDFERNTKYRVIIEKETKNDLYGKSKNK
jgi:hypothetical protein